MKLKLYSLFVVSNLLLLAGAVAAARQVSDPLLSDILKGGGRLVFLKAENLSATRTDGSKTYLRSVIYFENGRVLEGEYDYKLPAPGKLSCLAEYNTSRLDESKGYPDLLPGLDLHVAPGLELAWDMDPVSGARYAHEMNENGFYEETLSLRFLDGHALININCSAASNDPARRSTVSDFENATGGIMTLRPDASAP